MAQAGKRSGKIARGLVGKGYLFSLGMGVLSFALFVAALHMESILESLGITIVLMGEMIAFLVVVVGIDAGSRWWLSDMADGNEGARKKEGGLEGGGDGKGARPSPVSAGSGYEQRDESPPPAHENFF